MELVELFQKSEQQIISELKQDNELYEAATHEGIDFAGDMLPLRVHPEGEFVDLPTYWANLKMEFKELICNRNGKYASVYEEVNKANEKVDTWFLPIITGAIAIHVGIEVAILTPFVRLLVVATGRLGKEAYCRKKGNITDSDNKDIKI